MQTKDLTKMLTSKIDIVEVISSFVALKKAGREFQACCPFHQEKTPSFTVSPQKQFYYCFGCQAKGDAITFVMHHQQLSFKEAIEWLASKYQIPLPKTDQRYEKINPELYKLTRDIALACKQDLLNNTTVLAYLKKRHIDPEMMKKYHMGYCGDHYQKLIKNLLQSQQQALQNTGMLSQTDTGQVRAKFYQRLMFPIQDTTGRIIAFGGRVLDQRQPKYLNSPETELFKKRDTLYGLWQYKQSKSNTVFIVEGYMDVIALASHGIGNSVACLGTAFTENHWRLLRRFTHKATFCFDGDNAGKRAAWQTLTRILPALAPHNNAYFMFMPEGEDPDSLVQKDNGKAAFLQLESKAISWDNYLISHLKKTHDTSTVNGKAGFMQALDALAKTLTDPFLKKALLAGVSESNQPSTPPTSQHLQKTSHQQQENLLYNRILNLFANKDNTPFQFALHNNLSYDHPKQQIIATWCQACDKEPNISGHDLLSSLKETPLYEVFTQIQTPTTFNAAQLQHDLCELTITNLNTTIQKLLQQQATLNPQERAMTQALIQEKKQWQQKKRELAFEAATKNTEK